MRHFSLFTLTIFVLSSLSMVSAPHAKSLDIVCLKEVGKAFHLHSREMEPRLSSECRNRLRQILFGDVSLLVGLEGAAASFADRGLINRNIGFSTTDIFDQTHWCEFIGPEETCRSSNGYNSPPKNIKFFNETRTQPFEFDEGCTIFRENQIRSCVGQEVGRLYFDAEVLNDGTISVTNCHAACWPEGNCACNPLWEPGFLPAP